MEKDPAQAASMKAEEIAQWMLHELQNKGILHQSEAAAYIAAHFGESHLYVNDNGNLSIGKDVKKAFRKLHKGRAAWERDGFFWGWT